MGDREPLEVFPDDDETFDAEDSKKIEDLEIRLSPSDHLVI
jgi:hypothetical protein